MIEGEKKNQQWQKKITYNFFYFIYLSMELQDETNGMKE